MPNDEEDVKRLVSATLSKRLFDFSKVRTIHRLHSTYMLRKLLSVMEQPTLLSLHVGWLLCFTVDSDAFDLRLEWHTIGQSILTS